MATTKTWAISGCGDSINLWYSPQGNSKAFTSYADAEISAKKRAAKNQTDVTIFESIAVAKAVVPAIEIEKL